MEVCQEQAAACIKDMESIEGHARTACITKCRWPKSSSISSTQIKSRSRGYASYDYEL